MAKSFHCDFCGEKVKPDEDRCPGCGRFFKAVKCPVCTYTSDAKDFVKGCPNCGYLSDVKTKTDKVKVKDKKSDFLKMSRIFAYCSMAILSLLLVYFLILLFRT